MNKSIPKSESELLLTAIERIISNEVLETDISGKLPTISALRDSNTIYRGKVSVLFVDMRHSTQLPELFSPTQLVKIYRSYIRTIVQAVRYSGGDVREFMGDGVLAVFVDNEHGTAEDNAVYAARYIVTAIDKLLNPLLFKQLNYCISYGIGIHTGEISLSKVGMKGKEQDDESENEFGIAWIGNSTNLACKQSGAVDRGTIFISSSTYSALSDMNDKKSWQRTEIIKGDNILTGFISERNYLPLDSEITPDFDNSFVEDEITPCVLGNSNSRSIVEIIEHKTEELIRKAQELSQKEQELHTQAIQLKKKEELLNTKSRALISSQYYFYCDVLRRGYCSSEYTKAMGQDFWEEYLQKALSAGRDIEKSEHEVKQNISYIMVDIYSSLGLYDYAYDFLVEQAVGNSWLSLYTVQEIVNKVRCCYRLQQAISNRLEQNDLLPDDRKDFQQILDWLNSNFE